MITLEVKPASEAQEYFLKSTKRNILFNSGWGAGKTFIACFKLLLLLLKFPNSRAVIGRQVFTDLAKTTRETFYQVCPPELYAESQGGSRADARGYLKLINGSEIFFMHFDNVTLQSIKSLEINFLLLDQAEEILESIYLGLDARLGRKSDAVVPQELLAEYPDWPINEHTGRPMVPVYAFLLINPPDEGEMHYLIQRFHPTSPEWQEKWWKTNDYVWSSSRSNKALAPENLENMLTRDPKWIARYVDGEIGQGEGSIHTVDDLSIIEFEDLPAGFIAELRKKASLARVLDHAPTSPTSCLWFATYRGFYYCYQEYYVPGELISYHRQAINDLSEDDYYSHNIADPAIFYKSSEKKGGFWTVADEYQDKNLDSPPIIWTPGDNNEYATRNRINELLRVNEMLPHPITGKLGSPKLFFIKKSKTYPQGCFNVIRETKGQKNLLLDTINGKPIYSDERDNKSVSDHSYDCLRYFCASHLANREECNKKKAHPSSFFGLMKRMKALKQEQYYDQYQER